MPFLSDEDRAWAEFMAAHPEAHGPMHRAAFMAGYARGDEAGYDRGECRGYRDGMADARANDS